MTGDDAIAALATVLDDLDENFRTVQGTVKRSETNRLSMLHVHAGAAVVIAPLFALVGRDGMAGASWSVVRLIPGAPFTLAGALFAGGVILGSATWVRAVRWEMLGLWMLMLWYATVAVSFAGAVWLWVGHGMPGGLAKPSPYAPALYLHLSIIMGVHLWTLSRMRPTPGATR